MTATTSFDELRDMRVGRIENAWNAIRYRFGRNLRWRLRQLREFFIRGRRGWAPSDAWSLDVYLARVMGESLAHLADVNHGWPGEQSEWPTPEDWDAEIRKHAANLTAYADNRFALNWSLEQEQALHDRLGESLARLGTFWGHLWD